MISLSKDARSRPLRIGWASPTTLRSAIGRVSADVTDALINRGHQVSLISTENQIDLHLDRHPSKARVVHWSSMDPSRASSEFDLVVVNVGDNYLFHAGIFPFLERCSCLGVFHDFYLYNLFNGWLEDIGSGQDENRRETKREAVIVQTYGPDFAALAGRAGKGQLTLEELATQLPMTEWIARRCSGALGHAEFYLDRLGACPGPVGKASLPVRGRGVLPLSPQKKQDLTVLTVGVMNPNKCVRDVIAAIAASPHLSASVNYHLVGPIEPAEADQLKAEAKARGFERLSIFGAVDEAALKAHLSAADIICCLRRPILEGASGSAVEGLLAGRPMIVVDAGFYAGLPDDLVFKVPSDVPLQDLKARLEQLAANEPLRTTVGANAKAWAEQHFHVSGYVTQLESLMQLSIAADPILKVGRNLGVELHQLGLESQDPAVGRIASTLEVIFSHT